MQNIGQASTASNLISKSIFAEHLHGYTNFTLYQHYSGIERAQCIWRV